MVNWFGQQNRFVIGYAIKYFKKRQSLTEEVDVRASLGAYFINADINPDASGACVWFTVAKVYKDAGFIAWLKHFIQSENDYAATLQADVNNCTNDLVKILVAADSLQLTEDKLSSSRHLSN